MMRCKEVIELLPWWLNSTLAEEERQEVKEHLDSCESCVTELDRVRQASDAYDSHIPTQDLVDYGLGLEVSGVSREVLELHLSFCESCSGDLELVSQDSAVSMAIETRSNNGWRRLAVAASVAAAIGLSWPLWQTQESAHPSANIEIIELFPESFSTRRATPTNEELQSTGKTAVLLLISDRAEKFSTFRLQVTDNSEQIVWEVSGLERSETGAFTVLVPAGALPVGEFSFSLQGLDPTGWTPIESYQLLISE